MPQYAISDIHGHLATFRELLRRLAFSRADELFLLGDFIDRGPDSKGVIDYVEQLKSTGHQVHCLRGNHEQMALDAPSDFRTRQSWLKYGGKETCESFGSPDYTVPPAYLDWMAALPYYLETPGYLFVHAGIDTNLEAPLLDRASMLWARNWAYNLNRDWLENRIIVHGHTPTPEQDIQLSVRSLAQLPVINVDAGCFAVTREGCGQLCALELTTHRLVFQENIG